MYIVQDLETVAPLDGSVSPETDQDSARGGVPPETARLFFDGCDFGHGPKTTTTLSQGALDPDLIIQLNSSPGPLNRVRLLALSRFCDLAPRQARTCGTKEPRTGGATRRAGRVPLLSTAG